MSIQRNIQKSFLMGSTALTRPAATLGAMAAMVLGSGSAFAIDANTLPSGGTVTGGAATISQSGSRLDVNQSTNRTVLDWRSFDIGENAHVNFNQPNSGSIAVNRINQSTNPTQINGQLTANGHVWVLNPNGVMFGASARVDVSGLVASTANINVDRFMAGDTRLDLLGAGGGSVVNEGQITVREGGLAAFVAPHVRNNGTIRAKVGKVAMAAGETFTLDLAGDRLIEIGLGADGAKAEQLGQVVAEGGVIEISAKAATQVVDSIVNVEGITSAASATVAGGEIILGGGEVNVAGTLDASGATGGGSISIDGETITTASTAVLKADATDNGDGGSIIAYADGHGDYAGSFSAKGGANGGDGGFVDTSGETVSLDAGLRVATSAANGDTGTWLIDPVDLVVGTGEAAAIVSGLNSNDVDVQAENSITVNSVIDSSVQGNSNQLALIDENTDNDLTINLNAAITLGANQTLTGEGTVVNVNNGTSIQNGVDVAASGAQLNVGAGAYEGGIQVNKDGLIISGVNGTIVSVNSDATTTNATPHTGFNVSGDNVTIQRMDIQGPVSEDHRLADWSAGAEGYSWGIRILEDASGVTIQDNVIENVRSGILVNGNGNSGTVITGNTIENTKGAVLVQYTAGEDLDISGNQQGVLGNEWGAVLNLNLGTPINSAAPEARQSHILAVSQANGDWAVLDREYQLANRSHAVVDDDSTATAADDFSYGNGLGNERQPLPSIQAAINGIVGGGWISVADGTYALGSTLDISKSLTLTGTSQAGTVIDASGIGNAYAIQVEADNVDLNTFTLIGSPTNGSASYGIKVQPDTATVSDRVLGFSISDVTVQDSYRTALDLHAVDGATIDNFTALNTAWGNGITLTDSANVTITNSTTTGNEWGGLALYQSNGYYDLKSDNISIDATNTFNEDNPVYAQQYTAASQQFGDNITIEGFSHTITNPDTDNGDTVYTWFQRTLNDAIAGALAVPVNPGSSVVEGWDGSGGDGQFYVGSNGVSSMSIFSAVNAAESGDTVNVLEGTYTEDQQIVISKSLSILGDTSGNKPVITPGTDYTGNNAADAWFLVNDGVTFALSDVAIDGTGYNVWQALRSHGNTTVTNVDFSNIAGSASGSPYHGIAIEQFGGVVAGGAGSDTHGGGGLSAGHLTVTGSTFSDIGRIGVLIKGTQATSDITGNTFTGKGTGDFLDYGIEVGASGQATITGNTISGNRGVAASDGSGSAGILVTSYYGGASDVTMSGNTITDNTTAIAIGYDENDISNITASGNDFTGNDNGVVLTSADTTVDFSDNTFGDNSIHIVSDAVGLGVVGLLADNTFDRSVHATGGNAIYGGIQVAVDSEDANSTLNLSGDEFESGVNVNKDGVSLVGQSGTLINVANNEVGISVNADNVTISGIEIVGPVTGDWRTSDWSKGGPLSSNIGINIGQNRSGIVITGNNIHDIRSGINVDKFSDASITNNRIENTKGGVLVRPASITALSGNTEGPLGNEWGVVLNLQNIDDASTADAARQAFLLDLSEANDGMAVFDRGYGFKNRTHIYVDDDTPIATAADDFGYGNGLGNERQELPSIQAAFNSVVAGGYVQVAEGTYAGNATTNDLVNILGQNATVGGLTLNGAGSMIGGSFSSAVSGFTFGAPIILGDNLTLTTTGPATITAGAIDAETAGAQTLTVNAGGTASFGSLGGTTRLGATSITGAGTTLTGANYNANSLTFGGPVTLTQALTSFNSTISGTQAGNITFTGNIFGTANGAQSLNLIAGNGAGAKSSNGDVSIQNAGTQAVQLGGLTVNADDFSAATVWLAGDYNGTMTGNQTFTDETLNAGGNVSSTVGGNASGPINSGGNVNVNSGGNVSGNVSGNNVTLAGQNVNSNVTANQTANITAQNSVSGNVSAGSGGTINAGTVNTNLSGGSFTVNASGGSVTGNPSGLNTSGSGSLKVNGQTVVGSSDADFNQIVVEGFTLPAGATVTDTGEIVLPQGLAIGLISPAAGEGSEGTAPRVIFVRSVQRLGALLAEGYSAIVIDLNEGVSEEEQEMAMAQ